MGSINSLHREHAVACLGAGRDVFCEKPLATTVDDCLAIRDAVERSGRRFSLGLTMRYGRMNRIIKRMIEEGKAGVPISLEMNETLGFNHGGMIHSNWRRFTELAGTHLLEKCCHDIDCTDWFLGSLGRRVASFGGCNFFTRRFRDQVDRIGRGPAGEIPFRADARSETDPFTAEKDIVDNQVVIMEYENGARATFHLNCSTSIPERRFYLCGSEGTIRADRHSGRLEFQPIGWDEPIVVYPDTRTDGGHGGSDEVLCREVIDSMLHDAAPKAGVAEESARPSPASRSMRRWSRGGWCRWNRIGSGWSRPGSTGDAAPPRPRDAATPATARRGPLRLPRPAPPRTGKARLPPAGPRARATASQSPGPSGPPLAARDRS